MEQLNANKIQSIMTVAIAIGSIIVTTTTAFVKITNNATEIENLKARIEKLEDKQQSDKDTQQLLIDELKSNQRYNTGFRDGMLETKK